jgi:transcriptional regulator with XRE-family HTH domain
MVSFADTFREFRHARKLTVQQVAKRLKVNQSTISRWENGLVEPSWSMMPRICKVFRVKISKFL